VVGYSTHWRALIKDRRIQRTKILYYQSSMHPWIKSDKPGKCPICGMDLVPIYADEAA